MQSLLPADVDSVNRILTRYGVSMSGMTHQQLEKLKKTCLPKTSVTFDDFLKMRGNMSAEQTEAADQIYRQVFSPLLMFVLLQRAEASFFKV